MHLQQQLQHVSRAWDTKQIYHCSLGDVVSIRQDLDAQDLQLYKQILEKRFKQCITAIHLVASQAHPTYRGAKLNEDQEEPAAV